jgi:hypothetical protein
MDIRDIRAMHETEAGIIDDPYLPRDKAISMLQRAHQQRGLLLTEVERLRRERDEALARMERLQTMLDGFQGLQQQLGDLIVK